MSTIGRALDRYIFAEFFKIFVPFALGFPVLVVIIDLVDNLDKYMNRNIPRGDIALSYLYWLPDSMFMILPAAVLFATVFSIGALTRHSEITAAKASGISFYRLILPIFVGALIATGLGLVLGELVPIFNAKRLQLLQEDKHGRQSSRFNFVYAAERGRVYKVGGLTVDNRTMEAVEIERRGRSADYPTYLLTAESATYREPTPKQRGRWVLRRGSMHIIPDSNRNIVFTYETARDRHLRERPSELLATPKAPQEMGYRELGRYIAAMERSGSDVNELRVERMLKITIPVTCIVILLFGAPLATSTQRGGAAYGVGVSLGTTVVFLMLIQLMKAVGGKGLIPPDLAAWVPSIIFAVVGGFLLARVRT
jgi:lipopolysaccharide export system permease protein